MKTDMGTMEARLASLGARIDGVLAQTGHGELGTALLGELGVWREWIDEARVQAALGAMEGHDRVHDAMKALERLHSRMLRQVDLLKDAANPVPGLEDAIKRELQGAKATLSSPAAFTADSSTS